MTLFLLLFVLSLPVDSIERPNPGGNRKISREFLDFLHRQAEQQELTPKRTGNRYGQESLLSHILRGETFPTENRKPSSTEYLHQNNYGSLINPTGHENANAAKFRDFIRRPQSTGHLQSSTTTRRDGTRHLPYHVPNYGVYSSRGNEIERQRELTVKIGNHEIRIRPEDYEIKYWDTEPKSEVLSHKNFHQYTSTQFINEPYFTASSVNGEPYTVSASSSSGYLTSKEKPYPSASAPVASAAETEYSYSENPDLGGQVTYELSLPNQTISLENRRVSTKPEHLEQNVTMKLSVPIHNARNISDEVLKVHEKRRGIVTNGHPQRKYSSKDNISEHSFPASVLEAPEKNDDQNEDSDESWKLYPPLLIEEVNFPNVKHFESPEGLDHPKFSRELFPGETVIDNGTGQKSTTHPLETGTVQINETDLFGVRNLSDGSGSKEPVEEKAGATDFLNVDADDELIAGRNLDPDSNRAPFLEEEGSGLESFKDQTEDPPLPRGPSPRIVDIFASPNDSSTPCTTPKGESGHCRDIRHCILQEVLNNFNLYLQYVCLIRRRFVGVCCPDNPVISHMAESDEENSTDSTKSEIMEFSQPKKGCGANMKTRIVGGSVSSPHEWTWMVALLRKNRFFCGGVLINNWYVLTAAHCTLGVKPRDLKIRLGEYNFLETKEHKEDIGIQEIKRHAQFITLTFQHDIALLKLKRPVQFSRFVGTICLPQANQKYNEVNATVVGWGTVSFGGAASPVLREVTLPVLRNEDCGRTYFFEDINDSFLCAGSREPNQDACQGDSGGPLMALNGDGRWEAIGIVSWGRRCGDPKYPGVYTRIATYLDWIQKNMT